MAKASLKTTLKNSVFCNSSGGIAIMMGLLLIPLIGAVGLSMDSARGYAVKQRLQESVDAAALAAAKDMTMGVGQRKRIAEDYFNANWQDGYLFTKTVDLDVEADGSSGSVSIRAEVEMPTTLMRVLGEEKAIVSASSQAAQGASLIEVAVAIDNTFSMDKRLPDGTRRMDAVKQGATDLVDVLVEGSDPETLKMSLIPFSMVVNVGRENTSFLKAGSLTEANRWGWAFPSDIAARNIDQWKGCVFERAGKYVGSAQDEPYNAAEAYRGYDLTDDPPSVEGFEPYQVRHPAFVWNFYCASNSNVSTTYITQADFDWVDTHRYYDPSNKVARACYNPTTTTTVTSTATSTPTATPTPTPTPTVSVTRPGNYDGAHGRWQRFVPDHLKPVQTIAFKSVVALDKAEMASPNDMLIKVGTGVTPSNFEFRYAVGQEPDVWTKYPDSTLDRNGDYAGWTNLQKMIRILPGYQVHDLTPQQCACPSYTDKPGTRLGWQVMRKVSDEYWFSQTANGAARGGMNGRWIRPWPADTSAGQEPLLGGWGNSGCGLPIMPLTNTVSQIKNAIDDMDVPPARAAGEGAEFGYEGTLINQGLVWAWRTLSPRWRGLWSGADSSLPSDYSADNSKAIVILTDGLNMLSEPLDHPSAVGYKSANDWWLAAQPSYYSLDKQAYLPMAFGFHTFLKSNGESVEYRAYDGSQLQDCNAAPASGSSACSNPRELRFGYKTGSTTAAPSTSFYSDPSWQSASQGDGVYAASWFDLDSSAYGASYQCRLRNPSNTAECAYTKKTTIGGVSYPQYYLDLEQRMDATCTNIRRAGVHIYMILFAVGEHPYRDRAKQKFLDCVGSPANYYEAADRDTLREAFKDIGGKIVRLRLTQ